MAKVHKVKDGYWVFDCPGCNNLHSIQVPPWTFNEDLDKPTVSPSILVHPTEVSPLCHSFVKDGMIQFLGDCTHELANQTVEIPEWSSMKEVLNRD